MNVQTLAFTHVNAALTKVLHGRETLNITISSNMLIQFMLIQFDYAVFIESVTINIFLCCFRESDPQTSNSESRKTPF